MLCLRTDHKLTIICPNTLLGLKICDSPVLDFTIIQHDATNCEILFLTSSKQNRSVYTLCLISFPGVCACMYVCMCDQGGEQFICRYSI